MIKFLPEIILFSANHLAENLFQKIQYEAIQE